MKAFGIYDKDGKLVSIGLTKPRAWLLVLNVRDCSIRYAEDILGYTCKPLVIGPEGSVVISEPELELIKSAAAKQGAAAVLETIDYKDKMLQAAKPNEEKE